MSEHPRTLPELDAWMRDRVTYRDSFNAEIHESWDPKRAEAWWSVVVGAQPTDRRASRVRLHVGAGDTREAAIVDAVASFPGFVRHYRLGPE